MLTRMSALLSGIGFLSLFSTSYAVQTLTINSLAVVPNHPGSDASVFFSFTAQPYLSSSIYSTYQVSVYWTEQLSGRTGMMAIQKFYSSCSSTGYFASDGSSYTFSISKNDLGSGPLTVYVTVHLKCSYYRSYCQSYNYCRGSWSYQGTSPTVSVPSIKGSYAPFEVDFELWAGQQCHELADYAQSGNYLNTTILSTIKNSCSCSVGISSIYRIRYLCAHDDFLTIRGYFWSNHTQATVMLGHLKTALSSPRQVLLGSRQVKMQTSPCGVTLAAIDAPYCGKGKPPDTPSKTWYGDVVIEADTPPPVSSEEASLMAAVVVASVGSTVSAVAIVIIMAYIGYVKCRNKKLSDNIQYRQFGSEEDTTGRVTFGED